MDETCIFCCGAGCEYCGTYRRSGIGRFVLGFFFVLAILAAIAA